MNRLHICTENILENATLHKDKGVIENICVMRSLSLNGRRYTEKAMESAASKVGKSFWNHETAGMGGLFGSGPRDVRDMIGKLSNGRLEGDAVFADLTVRKKWRDEVFEIAEEYSDTCGFSIVAKGQYAEEKDEDGYDIVEDIEHLYSTDLVDEPATTHSMFESLCKKEDEKDKGVICNAVGDPEAKAGEGSSTAAPAEQKDPVTINPEQSTKSTKGGECNMFDKMLEILEQYFSKKELKGITEEQATDKVQDLLHSLTVTSSELSEENDRLKDEVKVDSESLDSTQRERDELAVKVEAFETRERKAAELEEKTQLISSIMKDVGLEEKDISEQTYTILLKLEEEEIKTMLESFKATAGGIHSSGKERKLDEGEGEGALEEIDTETFVKRYAKRDSWYVQS